MCALVCVCVHVCVCACFWSIFSTELYISHAHLKHISWCEVFPLMNSHFAKKKISNHLYVSILQTECEGLRIQVCCGTDLILSEGTFMSTQQRVKKKKTGLIDFCKTSHVEEVEIL